MKIEPMAGARVFVREDGRLQFECWKIDMEDEACSVDFKRESLAILEWMRQRAMTATELHYSQFTTLPK